MARRLTQGAAIITCRASLSIRTIIAAARTHLAFDWRYHIIGRWGTLTRATPLTPRSEMIFVKPLGWGKRVIIYRLGYNYELLCIPTEIPARHGRYNAPWAAPVGSRKAALSCH